MSEEDMLKHIENENELAALREELEAVRQQNTDLRNKGYTAQLEIERANLQQQLTQAQAENARLREAGEYLWIVLANVSAGNWIVQDHIWQEAAAKARDQYFAALKTREEEHG